MIAWFARNTVAANLLMIAVVAVGWVAATHAQSTLALETGVSGELSWGDLPEGSGLVVYFPGPVRGHLFLASPSGVAHLRCGPGDVIRRLAGSVRGHLVAGTEAREALEALGRELLPASALRELEGWSSVLFSGRSFLYGLPFEILAVEAGKLTKSEIHGHYEA